MGTVKQFPHGELFLGFLLSIWLKSFLVTCRGEARVEEGVQSPCLELDCAAWAWGRAGRGPRWQVSTGRGGSLQVIGGRLAGFN